MKNHQKDHLKQIDFIVILSLMVIDETDNLDYFLYRFNFSKNDQNRIKDINSFYKQKINSRTFSENNLNKPPSKMARLAWPKAKDGVILAVIIIIIINLIYYKDFFLSFLK